MTSRSSIWRAWSPFNEPLTDYDRSCPDYPWLRPSVDGHESPDELASGRPRELAPLIPLPSGVAPSNLRAKSLENDVEHNAQAPPLAEENVVANNDHDPNLVRMPLIPGF